MRQKITQRFVKSKTNSDGKWKEEQGKDLFIRDAGLAGFGLKVTPTGTVSFIYENTIRGRGSKRVTLGRFPSISVEEARDKALDTPKHFREGTDPHELEAQQKQERAEEQARSITLAELLESYSELRPDKTKVEYKKVINSMYPDWLDKSISSITEDDIAKAFHRKLREGHKAQAQKGLRYLKAIFNHAMRTKVHGQCLLKHNPVILAEALLTRDDKKTVEPRNRFIEPNDLFKFIRAVITETHRTARDLTLFLLFTGLRDAEAKGLKWVDVDFNQKIFTVRETKGKRDHTLPMGSFLYALLVSRYNLEGKHKTYVFPNKKGVDKVGSIRKQHLKVTKKTGIEFSPHDLRRSYATYLEQELGTNESVIGRLLNHAARGVTSRHYIKSKASSYAVLQENLFWYVNGNHDWTSDEGENRITSDYVKTLDIYKAAAINDLRYVLFDKELDVIKGLDLEYLSSEGKGLYYLVYEEQERPSIDMNLASEFEKMVRKKPSLIPKGRTLSEYVISGDFMKHF